VWNHLQTRVFDLSETLPVSGVIGTILSGLLGYHEAPTLGEAIVWAAFLAVTLFLFLRPAQAAPAAPAAAREAMRG
jgi:high-affinity iron transporter